MRRLSGALVSQAVVAGSSLLLQVVALRVLGLADFAVFALLVASALPVATGVHTSLAGDTLTVLDREDPSVRVVLLRLVWVGAPVVAGVLALLMVALGYADLVAGAVFTLLLLLWMLEDVLRRLLAARREYWRLVAVDATYAGCSVGGALVLSLASEATVTRLLAVMSAACLVALLVGLVLLPSREWRGRASGPGQAARVLSYGGWRALQVTVRPVALLVLRVVVERRAGPEALGLLEAARLLAAPAFVLINGAGNYLLPGYAARRTAATREGTDPAPGLLRLADTGVVGLVAAGASLGVVALVVTPVLEPLLDVDLDRVSVAAWTAYVVAQAAVLPYALLMAALERPRQVLLVQAAALGGGTVLACALVLLVPGTAGWSPAVLAGVAVLAAPLLRRADRVFLTGAATD